ncbi:MAG: efflux RND transporter permease subunit [Labrys sp. (in: a-proteobacteria)]
MTLSDLSIRRPVFATVVSLLIIVFGAASMLRLPIRELPDVDTAVITVTTDYTGAAPEIVDTDITEIIESALSGIAGVKNLSSTSSRGRSQTTIEFEVGRNIDEAANDVRDAVGRVRSRLPEDVEEPRIVKSDASGDAVMRLAITSDRMTPDEITDYVDRFIIDRFSTLDGVSSVDIFGERRYALRIWLDRTAMAARNLTVADVEGALRRNNVERPAGEITSINREMTVRLDSRLTDVEQFRAIVVSSIGGYPVKLGDIARVELGVEDDSTSVRANGVTAIGLGIQRQSQANTIAISNAVRAQIETIRPTLPEGMSINVGSDDALFISASIHEVMLTLWIALGLVVGVILAFLLSIRATIVPAVTIPVSLIGCFLLIYAMGFSINVLTLLALILAIGLVVDDAIVVLENVQRRIDLGESPIAASALGTRQVTFAVLATSATLIAVFVPLSFLGGQVGRLFVEFGFVMAGAVAISTFVALSLCPVLTAYLLRPHKKKPAAEDGKPRESRLSRIYRGMIAGAINMPLVIIGGSLAFAAGGFALYQGLPQELTPREDRGVIFVALAAPQGATSAFLQPDVTALEKAAQPLRESGDVTTIFSILGSGGSNRAFVVLRLAPWDQRATPQSAIIRQLIPPTMALTGSRGFPIGPSGLGLRGSNTPLRIVVSGPDFESVKAWAAELQQRAQANPGLRNVELDYEENQAQLNLVVDRAKADDLGISVDTIASTLQTLFASREVTTFIDRGREYKVILQAEATDRQTPADIANVFVRAGDGTSLVPLSALVKFNETAASPELRRFGRLPSITVQAALAENYDLGSAIAFMEQAAADVLPPQAKLGYSGQTQQFKETSSGVAITFALALLIVFLVLAAQFESYIHPLIIMLSVPLAVAGALYAMAFGGIFLNIYSQIGMILLVGLMAKNGILIVEFANQMRDEGMSVREAVIEASVLRLRPILMTVIATILGAVPLVFSVGAGAESRVAIGVVIVGGLSFASILTLFLTPVLYDLLARFTKPRGTIERMLDRELATIEAKEKTPDAKAQPSEPTSGMVAQTQG